MKTRFLTVLTFVRIALLLLWSVSVLPMMGCSPANADKNDEPVETPALTIEAARSALIEMLAKHPNDAWWQAQLTVLQNAPFEKAEDGTLIAGTWCCNLSKRWFRFDIGTPTDNSWWSFHGEFELTADGKWHAKITDRTHGSKD